MKDNYGISIDMATPEEWNNIRANRRISSDGGDTPDLYAIPDGARDCIDIAEAKGMAPNRFNIFKAVWRWDEKAGTDLAYNLRKILFSAQRVLETMGYTGEIKITEK